MGQNLISNKYNHTKEKQDLQSNPNPRLFIILFSLCALFFLLIQPSLFKFLLLSSPMLWECM